MTRRSDLARERDCTPKNVHMFALQCPDPVHPIPKSRSSEPACLCRVQWERAAPHHLLMDEPLLLEAFLDDLSLKEAFLYDLLKTTLLEHHLMLEARHTTHQARRRDPLHSTSEVGTSSLLSRTYLSIGQYILSAVDQGRESAYVDKLCQSLPERRLFHRSMWSRSRRTLLRSLV